MKYKVIGFFTLVAVVLCTVFVTAYPTDNKMRYHQHLSSAVPEACSDHGEEKFCTHLPIIMINTNGEEIPGRRVKDENGRNIGFTTSSDGSDRIRAGITVIDNEKKRNHTDDAPALDELDGIAVAPLAVYGKLEKRVQKGARLVELVGRIKRRRQPKLAVVARKFRHVP